MAVRNLEIRKHEAGYDIGEQRGSNPHKAETVHQAPDRKDAERWLREQGGDAKEIAEVLQRAEGGGVVLLEISGDYSEAEGFPRL